VALGEDAERVRVRLVVHTAHGLPANTFVLRTETHALAVSADAGGEVTAAAVITAAIAPRAIKKNGHCE